VTLTTTEAILHEDGAEAAFEALRRATQQAESLFTEILREDKTRQWTFAELQDELLSHVDLSDSAIGAAFGNLKKAGVLYQDDDLRIHAL
jgi:hypothetical protein